jgi:hypothetical protein
MLVTMHLGGGYHFWQPGPKCMLVTMHLGGGYHFWQPDPKCMLVTMHLGGACTSREHKCSLYAPEGEIGEILEEVLAL